MPLTSAEKQARYRKRNVVLLTADAHAIADKLMEMQDQAKLIQIVALLKDRLDPTDGRCRWVKDDGGRRKSGIARGANRKDKTGDCVTRAIAIATEKPYQDVHDALTVGTVRHVYAGDDDSRYPKWDGDSRYPKWTKWARRRGGVRAFDPDHGCFDVVYGTYLESLGWSYTSTGSKKVRLRADELPRGRLIVRISNHLVAVIDHVIYDTCNSGGAGRVPVKGYWTSPPTSTA